MTYDSITVMQSSPHVGAEIGNVDLSKPLSNREVEEIRNAINSHGVVFFRDQELDPESHDRFIRYFGEPHVHAGGKSTMSKAVPGYPALRKQHFDRNSTIIAGERWHSDQSCAEIPPMYSVLYQEIIPPDGGGNTMFLSAAKAYEELSPGMKAYLEGKTATHNAEAAFIAKQTKDNKETHLVAEHPMVVEHPETGRKVLFV
ncbi:MAG: TauD/TfdA family dioxygenase, partial [Rhodospirillaceae bacterium]|nr:TauD/TfdA family dioxygenase [Rhodospirillaceae bacterium]